MDTRTLRRGLRTIAKYDSDVEVMLNTIGFPEPRIRPAGFETFLTTIISQQISVAAAKSITQRVFALLPKVDAPSLLALTENELRSAGMSRRKVEYAQGLAQTMVDGEFDPESLASMDNQEAIDSIVRLRGFGRWSAEIYLMFSLGRRDIFPADDLILLVSLQRLKSLKDKPTPKQARQLISHWSPWLSAGSLFLWHMHHCKE